MIKQKSIKQEMVRDFGVWVTAHEGLGFLRRLGISPENLNPNYHLLQSIIESVVCNIPFHNLFLLTRLPAAPSPLEIRKDMLDGLGGPCGTQNPFIGALLRQLGFDVFLVSASMMQPNCHLGLLVNLDGERYYVDCGDGKPYFYPMNIRESSVKINPSYTYKHHLLEPNFLVIQFLNPAGEWETNCTVCLERQKFSFFENYIHRHYTEDGYGPFRQNFRLVHYPNRRIKGFRNLLYLSENESGYSRKELKSPKELAHLALLEFSHLKLPIKEAIEKLNEKNVWPT